MLRDFACRSAGASLYSLASVAGVVGLLAAVACSTPVHHTPADAGGPVDAGEMAAPDAGPADAGQPEDAGNPFCRTCTKDSDCGGAGNYCVDSFATGSTLCGVACSADGGCPAGASCVPMVLPDGGAPDICFPTGGICPDAG